LNDNVVVFIIATDFVFLSILLFDDSAFAFYESVWTMLATILAAIPSFEMIFRSENHVSFLTKVVIFLVVFVKN